MYETYCLHDDKVYVILFDINLDAYDNTCGSQLGFVLICTNSCIDTLFVYVKVDHRMPGLFIKK